MHTNTTGINSVKNQMLNQINSIYAKGVASNICIKGINRKGRTTAKDGLSCQELYRINAAAHEIKTSRWKNSDFIYLVLGDELLQMPVKKAHEVMREFQNYLMLNLRRNGFPPLWLNVLEVSGGVHANYFFLGDFRLVTKLAQRYACFCKSGIGRGSAIQILTKTDFESKVRYVCKERSTQTNLMDLKGYPRRKRKSHQLEGGGDRVRLSKELEKMVLQRNPALKWTKSLCKST